MRTTIGGRAYQKSSATGGARTDEKTIDCDNGRRKENETRGAVLSIQDKNVLILIIIKLRRIIP